MSIDGRRRLILFSKVPRAGRVKTRLAPALDEAARTELYRAFVADQLAFLAAFAPDRVELWFDGAWRDDELAGLPLDGVRLATQVGRDLGERMLHALESGTGPSIVVAADSPTLPAHVLSRAFDALAAGADAVVGPADDGGYVLVGVRDPRRAPAPMFRDIPWGTGAVLVRTRQAARRAGIRLDETAGWYDVDDPAGLERLRAELGRPAGRARASRSAAVLLDAPGNTVV